MTDYQPTRLTPPVYLMAALVLMYMLNRYANFVTFWEWPWTALGLVPVVAGFGLVMYCARLHGRHKTTLKPYQEASVLITDGPHRVSRNPIYAGMVVMLVGVAILLGSALPWLVVPFFVVTITNQFIKYEESALAERFGDQYTEYRRQVRRWI
jgi:protein-S-isoprenylcysteine O-methyltransferase Ste14